MAGIVFAEGQGDFLGVDAWAGGQDEPALADHHHMPDEPVQEVVTQAGQVLDVQPVAAFRMLAELFPIRKSTPGFSWMGKSPVLRWTKTRRLRTSNWPLPAVITTMKGGSK